ncbi:MAG: hypothetical protein ABSE62_10710 [Chthoniobacteraceae bacterium]|jgi:hypothetical protein
MTTIHANVPDYLAKLAQEAAQKENVTVDQIVALALSAQISAWNLREDIETRAKRGKAADLERILSKAPNRAPLPGDEL